MFEIGLLITLTLFNNAFSAINPQAWVDYDALIEEKNFTSLSRSAGIVIQNSVMFNRTNNDNINDSKYPKKRLGGTKASIATHNYQVSIQEQGLGHFCGGSLVTMRWVLTAASCFYGQATPMQNYFVRAGSSWHTKGGVLAKPTKIYIGKKYSPKTNSHDIAMMKLKNGFKRFETDYPINYVLLATTLPLPGSALTVTGWGTTVSERNTFPTDLRKATIPMLGFDTCNTRTLHVGLLTPTMFCAGSLKGSWDSCQGDTGGPILYGDKQVGIVSWSNGCAQRNAPVVFTRVPKYLRYIRNLIENA